MIDKVAENLQHQSFRKLHNQINNKKAFLNKIKIIGKLRKLKVWKIWLIYHLKELIKYQNQQ